MFEDESNPFNEFLTSKIKLVKNESGEEFKDIKANIQGEKIYVFDETIPFEIGDIVIRELKNGIIQEFSIIKVDLIESPFKEDIPDHFKIIVKDKKSNEDLSTKNQNFTNHFYGDISQSQIQQGSEKSSQNMENPQTLINELEKELKKENPDKIKLKEYMTKCLDLGVKYTPKVVELLIKYYF